MSIPQRGGVHFSGPLKNKAKSNGSRQWYSELPVGQSPELITYMNDFLVAQDYAAGDWVVTETQAGATQAIEADVVGGALLLTNTGTENDVVAIQGAEETWAMAAGKRMWFEARFRVSDADQADVFIGVAITDASVLDATDRAGFVLVDGSADLKFEAAKDSTASTISSLKTVTDAGWTKVSMYWDGVSKLHASVDGEYKGYVSSNIPDNEQMALVVHLQAGAAAVQTCSVDYLYAAQER
jgi:hypothetical protein